MWYVYSRNKYMYLGDLHGEEVKPISEYLHNIAFYTLCAFECILVFLSTTVAEYTWTELLAEKTIHLIVSFTTWTSVIQHSASM